MKKMHSKQKYLINKDNTCLWVLLRRQMTLMRPSSSVPKPFIAFRSALASATASKGVAGKTVGVPWNQKHIF
jgi:hypothetical protein